MSQERTFKQPIVTVVLTDFLDFYNLTKSASIKTVNAVRHISIPPLLRPYTEVTVKAIVGTTIFVCQIKMPNFSKTGIENTEEVHNTYLSSIYNDLKASGYVSGDIKLTGNTED
jgi:hypothetical protein